jgi:hypothetical protein
METSTVRHYSMTGFAARKLMEAPLWDSCVLEALTEAVAAGRCKMMRSSQIVNGKSFLS